MTQLMLHSTVTAPALVAALFIGWHYYVGMTDHRGAPAKARSRRLERDAPPSS